MAKKLIRFDWAMKKMLRHKANFDILEGFTIPQIARVTQKSEDEIKKILNEHRNV